jgi:hypothetical protein
MSNVEHTKRGQSMTGPTNFNTRYHGNAHLKNYTIHIPIAQGLLFPMIPLSVLCITCLRHSKNWVLAPRLERDHVKMIWLIALTRFMRCLFYAMRVWPKTVEPSWSWNISHFIIIIIHSYHYNVHGIISNSPLLLEWTFVIISSPWIMYMANVSRIHIGYKMYRTFRDNPK